MSKREPLVAVADTLTGTGTHDAAWRFPLDPSLVATIEGRSVRFDRAGERRWLTAASTLPSAWTLEPGWVSPSYGVRHATQVVTLRAKVALPFRLSYVFSSVPRPDPAGDAAMLLSH